MLRTFLAKGGAKTRLLAPFLALAPLVAAASCSSTPPPAAVAEGCAINSDCASDLVCTFGRCHVQCTTSKDCNGAACLPSGVCELPQDTVCSATLPCVTGVTCEDDTCRTPCLVGAANGTQGGCVGTEECTTVSSEHVCVDRGAGDAGHKDSGAKDGGSTRDGGSRDATVSDAREHEDGASDAKTIDARRDTSSEGDDADTDATGNDAANEPDALEHRDAGCIPDASSGPLGFTPSNFDPLGLVASDGGAIPVDAGPDGGGIDWNTGVNVDVTANCNGLPCLGVTPVTIALTVPKGSSPACEPDCVADLYVLNSLKIQSGVSVNLDAPYTAASQSNPIILAVRTVVQIDGALNLTGATVGAPYSPGPGGFPVNVLSLGPGGGGGGETVNDPKSDPGGAGFCGAGGRGGAASGSSSIGGGVYGLATIIPLQAGSAGGTAGNGNANDLGGAGGGALQISAGTSITIGNTGVINANGGGYFGGGGSGGAILLEAPSVTIQGAVVANGGGGGSLPVSLQGQNGRVNDVAATGIFGGNGSAGAAVNGANGAVTDAGPDGSLYVGAGGGGAGWIRINTACGATITADSGSTFVSPYLDSGCASTGAIAY